MLGSTQLLTRSLYKHPPKKINIEMSQIGEAAAGELRSSSQLSD